MKVENFVDLLDADFYTGVPDSQLKSLCDYLYHTYGIDGTHHIIAANEGNAVGLAAGYHLATGKIPVVYMQNSGEGNAINPLASLMNEKVYRIPCIFIIGWRGEPGTQDEPQHIYQGEITTGLLELMGIEYMIIGPDTTIPELCARMEDFKKLLYAGYEVAFVIQKGALTYDHKIEYSNDYGISRENAIKSIAEAAENDLIVCTTGKASRELYEIREANGEGHEKDFLTVGSMGHASSIALGIAINTEKTVWCIDGDGAVLMHMGAMGVIGYYKPNNLIHIVINNGAHESVGGMPTVGNNLRNKELTNIAQLLGYDRIYYETSLHDLKNDIRDIKEKRKAGLTFMEIGCSIYSRENLGRPLTTPMDNKMSFMKFVGSL